MLRWLCEWLSLPRSMSLAPDSMLRLAVERTLEIVGEAARRVSPGFRAAHPEIPWRDIISQRNILAHEYGIVDATRLWDTAREDTRTLIEALDRILPPHQAG
jgi:uncharacterized protein with HEPN domain